jgi:hypothetical protein
MTDVCLATRAPGQFLELGGDRHRSRARLRIYGAWALAVTLAMCALLAPPAAAQPVGETWVLLARWTVDLGRGSESIDVSRASGAYKAVRVQAESAPISLTRVQVVYSDGHTHNEDRRIALQIGERTRLIDPGEDRFVDRVDLTFERGAQAQPRATVTIWGLQSPTGATALRKGPGMSRVVVVDAKPAAPVNTGGSRGASRGPASSGPSNAIPDFPWPPPRPSDRVVIDRRLLVGPGEGSPTMGSVTGRLLDALQRAGYSDRSFYRIPDRGVAMVTRMEKTLPDGGPDPRNRWQTTHGKEQPSLRGFLAKLLLAQPGYYRVIAFVLTPDLRLPTGKQITGQEADALVRDGAMILPASLAGQPYTADHSTVALIYEFEKANPDATARQLVDPHRLPAQQHLEKAAILPALQRNAPTR